RVTAESGAVHEPLAHADAGLAERIAMAWLALWCVVLGLFPTLALRLLNGVSVAVTGAGLPDTALNAGVLWLVPSTQAHASYGPLIFLLVITLVVFLTYFAVRKAFHGRIRRAPPWDCG